MVIKIIYNMSSAFLSEGQGYSYEEKNLKLIVAF